MAYDELCADRLRQVIAQQPGFVEKKMFGGIAFLLNGNMCCGVHKDHLVLRLGPEQGETALEQPHVKAFDITGRPMKGWVMVAPDGYRNDDLIAWVSKAVNFVSSLPIK